MVLPEQETTRLSSGENTTKLTQPEWPRMMACLAGHSSGCPTTTRMMFLNLGAYSWKINDDFGAKASADMYTCGALTAIGSAKCLTNVIASLTSILRSEN